MPNIRSEINDHKKKKNPTTQAHRATQIMQLLVKEDWTMNGSCTTSKDFEHHCKELK